MNEQQQAANQGNNKLWIIIGIIILITAAAILLVPSDKPETADIPQPSVQPESAVVMPTAPSEQSEVEVSKPEVIADEPVVIEEVTTPPVPLPAGGLARQLIAEQETQQQPLDTLYTTAVDLQQKGEFADAWLLNFYLAKKGHGAACLALAKQADPVFFTASQSVLDKPDMLQAYKWYIAAKKAGNEEASALLKQLHQTVISAADTGNPIAQTLLLQW